jgi:hypothetical protein
MKLLQPTPQAAAVTLQCHEGALLPILVFPAVLCALQQVITTMILGRPYRTLPFSG